MSLRNLIPTTIPTIYNAKQTDNDIEKRQIPELKLLQGVRCK